MTVIAPEARIAVSPAGAFFASATAADRTSQFRVRGDAATVSAHGITEALVVAQPNSSNDPSGSSRLDTSFAPPSTFAGATALTLSVARITEVPDDLRLDPLVNAVVLIGRTRNLYVRMEAASLRRQSKPRSGAKAC